MDTHFGDRKKPYCYFSVDLVGPCIQPGAVVQCKEEAHICASLESSLELSNQHSRNSRYYEDLHVLLRLLY